MNKKIFLAVCIGLLGLTATPARAIEVSFEKDTSLPLVYINLAIKAGSGADPVGKSGITNFMGEMLLRGTNSRTKEQIDLALDQMGAQLEVEVRAEAMILRGAVLTTQLEPFLKLVTELVSQSNFPELEIRKLKSELISSILEEQGNDRSLATKKFTRFLFDQHPYGNPILGLMKDIEKLTREQVVAHYDALVREKLMVIVGNGDADLAMIRSWADSLAATRAGGQPNPVVAKPQDAPKRRLQIVDKPERTQTHIVAGQIGLKLTDEDFFPLYVGNHAFGGNSFSSRLMVEIRVKRGWSYGAGSAFRFGLQPRSWHLLLFPASKDTAPALETTLKMVTDLQSGGITAEEFQFAQKSLVNNSGFMYNTPKKRVENTLLERTLDLPKDFMKSYGPKIQGVSHEQVNRALKGFLHSDRLAITVLATAKEMKEPLAKAAGVPVSEVKVVPYNAE